MFFMESLVFQIEFTSWIFLLASIPYIHLYQLLVKWYFDSYTVSEKFYKNIVKCKIRIFMRKDLEEFLSHPDPFLIFILKDNSV